MPKSKKRTDKTKAKRRKIKELRKKKLKALQKKKADQRKKKRGQLKSVLSTLKKLLEKRKKLEAKDALTKADRDKLKSIRDSVEKFTDLRNRLVDEIKALQEKKVVFKESKTSTASEVKVNRDVSKNNETLAKSLKKEDDLEATLAKEKSLAVQKQLGDRHRSNTANALGEQQREKQRLLNNRINELKQLVQGVPKTVGSSEQPNIQVLLRDATGEMELIRRELEAQRTLMGGSSERADRSVEQVNRLLEEAREATREETRTEIAGERQAIQDIKLLRQITERKSEKRAVGLLEDALLRASKSGKSRNIVDAIADIESYKQTVTRINEIQFVDQGAEKKLRDDLASMRDKERVAEIARNFPRELPRGIMLGIGFGEPEGGKLLVERQVGAGSMEPATIVEEIEIFEGAGAGRATPPMGEQEQRLLEMGVDFS